MGATPAFANYERIAGRWSATEATCATPERVLTLAGNALTGLNNFGCDFREVRRLGETVKLHGQCGTGELRRATVVVARVALDRLDIGYVDRPGAIGTQLVRCPREWRTGPGVNLFRRP